MSGEDRLHADQTPAEATVVYSMEGLLYGIYWPTWSWVQQREAEGVSEVEGLL